MRFKVVVLALAASFAASSATVSSNVTFFKDALPVLQNKCQECHRAGEVAPMSFTTYDEVRPWAKAIKTAVVTKKMPPWFADPHVGKFSNDRSLSQAEIDTLVAWVDGGAKEGNAKDAPKPREYTIGWQIGTPDQVLELPTPIEVPASGVVDYTYVVMPLHFTEDHWVKMAEVRPDQRSVIHHVLAFVRDPGSHWLEDAKPGVPYIPQAAGKGGDGGGLPGELLVGYAPGLQPQISNPGEAKLLKAGSDIVLQLHYTPNGKAVADQTKIGLIYSKEPPERRVMSMMAANFFLKIPAGNPNYEVHSRLTLPLDVKLVNLLPHMHLRGKDFEFKAVYPTGETQVLLSVPHYDFSWQLMYITTQEIPLPKNTRIECTAHFDNSANNPANPDPTKVVRWGDQTFEEMMVGFFDVSFPANMDPAKLAQQNNSE
jgi:hypothetical protein